MLYDSRDPYKHNDTPVYVRFFLWVACLLILSGLCLGVLVYVPATLGF